MNGRTIALSFDDACGSHRRLVAPLLREYGFGATFFVCEFPPDFATNREQYMSWGEIAEVHAMGFEIGNHLLTHPGASALSASAFREELTALECRARQYGIDRMTGFAWPGGDIADDKIPVLRDCGYCYARTCETVPYRPGISDPWHLPSYPVHGDDFDAFVRIVEQAADGVIPVLLYHGVPEYTHPWVNTPEPVFRREMAYLAEHGFEVVALEALPDR